MQIKEQDRMRKQRMGHVFLEKLLISNRMDEAFFQDWFSVFLVLSCIKSETNENVIMVENLKAKNHHAFEERRKCLRLFT
jgi:hypothetical protein